MKRKYHIIIFVFSLLCLYAVIAIPFPYFRIVSLPLDKNYIEKAENIIQNLSYSFLAGTIFYFLSVYLPNREKNKNVSIYIGGLTLKLYNYAFFSSFELFGYTLRTDRKNEFLHAAMVKFRNDSNTNPANFRSFFNFHQEVADIISELYSYHDFLDKEQQQICSSILNSHSFSIITEIGKKGQYFYSEKGYKMFVESIFDNIILMEELVKSTKFKDQIHDQRKKEKVNIRKLLGIKDFRIFSRREL